MIDINFHTRKFTPKNIIKQIITNKVLTILYIINRVLSEPMVCYIPNRYEAKL